MDPKLTIPSTSDIQSQLNDNVTNMITDTISTVFSNMITNIIKQLKSIPIFNKIILEFESPDKSIFTKPFTATFLLIIMILLVLLAPWFMLIGLNLLMTFILIFVSQTKCIK
jgi:hypothetical protein